jgi:hypothetical protein
MGRRVFIGKVIAASIGFAMLSSCGGGSATATQLIINWNANHESGVNTPGGGYRVYYATSPGVSTSTASYISVPYVSGTLAPTSATLTNPPSATYYFRVVAYSIFDPPTGSSTRRSADSAEISVQFP